jgi:hypothetical protein
MKSLRRASQVSSRTVSPAGVSKRASRTQTFSVESETVDVDMAETDDVTTSTPSSKRKFVIGVDYGTTFSAVSYVIVEPDSHRRIPARSRIYNIRDFPGDPRHFHSTKTQVPSEIWYMDKPRKRRGRPPRAVMLSNPNPSYHADQLFEMDDEDSDVSNDHIQSSYTANNAKSHSTKGYWGFEVQKALGDPNSGAKPEETIRRCVRQAKLLLDNSEATESARQDLTQTLQQLKEQKLIKRDEDVITDFLTHLSHVKSQLEERHSLSDDCDVEFVLCVPPVWTTEASTTMTRAMSTAAHDVGFKTSRIGTIEDFFIVSEPEAAATYFIDQAGWDRTIKVRSR